MALAGPRSSAATGDSAVATGIDKPSSPVWSALGASPSTTGAPCVAGAPSLLRRGTTDGGPAGPIGGRGGDQAGRGAPQFTFVGVGWNRGAAVGGVGTRTTGVKFPVCSLARTAESRKRCRAWLSRKRTSAFVGCTLT